MSCWNFQTEHHVSVLDWKCLTCVKITILTVSEIELGFCRGELELLLKLRSRHSLKKNVRNSTDKNSRNSGKGDKTSLWNNSLNCKSRPRLRFSYLQKCRWLYIDPVGWLLTNVSIFLLKFCSLFPSAFFYSTAAQIFSSFSFSLLLLLPAHSHQRSEHETKICTIYN